MAEERRLAAGALLPGTPGSDLVRTEVWELPVRITHWLVFLSFVALAVTGYYIHNPYLTLRGDALYTMATMRFTHVVAAFVFTLSFLWRIYWFFVGNRCARWGAFIPRRGPQWRAIGEMLRYYTFLRWYPTHRIGHNALAAVVYLFMFAVMAVQILTGFAMYSRVLGTAPVTTLFGWLPDLINVQYLRTIHYFIMFLFFAFMLQHVYLAVLVSSEERNGILESIFTGFKFVPEWELTDEEAACLPEFGPSETQLADRRLQGQP